MFQSDWLLKYVHEIRALKIESIENLCRKILYRIEPKFTAYTHSLVCTSF